VTTKVLTESKRASSWRSHQHFCGICEVFWINCSVSSERAVQ